LNEFILLFNFLKNKDKHVKEMTRKTSWDINALIFIIFLNCRGILARAL